MGRVRLKHVLVAAGLVASALSFAQRGQGRSGPRFEQGLPKDAPPILAKAFKAAFRLRYSGERTVSFRRGADRRQHVEYVLKDGPRIRIWFPSDSPMTGQVIVENGKQRQHYVPAKNEIYTGPAMHDDAFRRLASFLKKGQGQFKIVAQAGDAIAGHKSTVVAVADPRGNVLQRMWIDERTGLMLKREMYDPAGAVVGAFEFTRVNYDPRFSPEDFQIRVQGAKTITPEDTARRLMRENAMLPAFLDEDKGLRLASARVFGRGNEAKVLMLTYDTDKGPITLAQIKGSFEPERLKRLARDEFKTHAWTVQDRSFALIGDLSQDALKRLAGRLVVRRES